MIKIQHSWDLTRSTEISQDLLRYHKIFWDLTRSSDISHDLLMWQNTYMTFDIWTFTFAIWHLLSQDLLRSHKFYWDLTRSTKISQDLLIWQHTFDIWTFTFDIDMPWHTIWHLLRSHKIYWFGIIHSTFGIWLGVNRNMDLKDAAFLKSKKEERKRVHLLLGR